MTDEEIQKQLEEANSELISLKRSSLIELGFKAKKAEKLNSLPILNALIEEYKERKKEAETKAEEEKKNKGFLENLPDQFGTNPQDLPVEKPKLRGNKLFSIKNASAEGQHFVFNKDAPTRVYRIHNSLYPEGFVF